MQFLSRSTIRYKALRGSDGCIQLSGCTQFSPRLVRAAITKCREQRDLERTENLFLTILKAGKSKTRDGQIRGDFLLCPHRVGGTRERSQASFMRALIPLLGAEPCSPNRLPKIPPPNTITWGLGFQPMNSGVDKGQKHLDSSSIYP